MVPSIVLVEACSNSVALYSLPGTKACLTGLSSEHDFEDRSSKPGYLNTALPAILRILCFSFLFSLVDLLVILVLVCFLALLVLFWCFATRRSRPATGPAVSLVTQCCD